MPARQLPVSPDVQHIKHEAKHLLRAFRANDSAALADFREFSSKQPDAATAKLSDAQLVLARSYGATSFPQLIAAVELIRACWGTDGNRLREVVLAHAEILKDYHRTPHDGWREDLRAAAIRGMGVASKSMRDDGAQIADAQARQAHAREWLQILRTLRQFEAPFTRAAPAAPIVIRADSGPHSEVPPQVQQVTENADLIAAQEDKTRRLWMEQRMKESAQDPTKINRNFERMRAHNIQYPTEFAQTPEQRRRSEWMNECLRLYIQTHPLP